MEVDMGEKRTHSRLRRLALDYANGRISRDGYRRARTQFLDALASHRPRAEADTLEQMAPTLPVTEPATSSGDRKRSNRLLLSGIAAGICALLVIIALTLAGAFEDDIQPDILSSKPVQHGQQSEISSDARQGVDRDTGATGH